MNKAMSKVFIVAVVLFVALVVNLTWIMVVRAQWFQDRPENKRSIAKEMKIKRGDIVGYDGSVIAGTERRSGYYYRDYPNGTLAPQLVGYDSVQYGRSGIEAQLNDELTGQSVDLGVQNWVDKLLGRRPKGANVKLTLVPAVQKVAQQALQGKKGAIVVLDPKTGALIASASAPTYDPANLDERWATFSKDPSAPLLNRPTQGLYVPGLGVQGRHRLGRARHGQGHARRRRSSTPAPTSSSAARSPTTAARCTAPTTSPYALTASINTTFAKVGNLLGRKRLITGVQQLRLLPDAAAAAAGRRGRAQRPVRQEGPALAGRVHGPARRRPGRRAGRRSCSPRRCRWRSWPAAWPTAAAS